MAINQGGGGGEGGAGGGGTGAEDPNYLRRVASGFGNSPEVAADVQRQNQMNQGDPMHWLTNASQISDSPWLMGLPSKVTGALQDPQGPGMGIVNATGLPNPIPGLLAPGGGGVVGMASLGGPPQIPGISMGANGNGGGVGTLEGLDFTKMGALEQYQKDMGGYFKQPTLSEMFAKDSLAAGPGAAPSNRAEEAYQQFNSSNPANMDPYYANQRRIAEENIRKTMAARGSYGSSAADDLYNEAYTNLAADQAKAEAQYGLQRGSLLGSLAQGADSSSLAGSNDRRNWMSALGALAGQGDSAGLNRVIAGGNLAGAAQGAQRTRGQDAFNNQLQMGDRFSSILGQGYGNIFGSDADLFKTGVGLNTGTATEGYNQAAGQAAQNRTDVGNFNNLLGGNLTMGRGLVDMFQQGSGPPPQPSPMAPAGYAGPSPDQNYGTSNYYFPGRP